MKKILVLFLAVCMIVGLFCACAETEGEGKTDTSNTGSLKELPSHVRYTSYYERGEEKSESELVMDFTWTENGAVMEGYQIEDGQKIEVRMEAVFDEQKRPLSVTKTTKDGDRTEVEKIGFSYPSDTQIKMTRIYGDEYINEAVYIYDENGRLIQRTNGSYTSGYEYDAHGNCVREWTDYINETSKDWERTTVYTYDDSGKAVFAVKTSSNDDEEVQIHYYYYPNGNVMFTMEISSHGYSNSGFMPYNSKDFLSWSSAKSAVGGYVDYEVEKDARGYITKVVRVRENPDDTDTVTFEYDDKGNLIKEVSDEGEVTVWEYDAQNRPIKYQYGDYSTRVYEYDEQGRLVSEKYTDAKGSNVIDTWAYNEEGMTTTREYKAVRIYNEGGTETSEDKIEIAYVENSNCTIDPQWATFFLQFFVSIN